MKIRIAIVALAAVLAAGLAHGETPQKPTERPVPRILLHYYADEHVQSADDDRFVMTQMSISDESYVSFGHSEQVKGATTPEVRTLNFSNDYLVQATPEQVDALIKALTEAGIYSLKGDDASSGYYAMLNIRIDKREADLTFHSPPTEGARLAVHKVLLDFARQMDIDHARSPGSEAVSQGDSVPAQTVAFNDLLAHPETYDGKRVRLTGYYHGEFEGRTFCVDRTAADAHDYDQCLWHDEASTFANPDDLDIGNDRWETIDGVFFKGPGGHLGLWPGAIERLTQVKPLVATKKP